MHSSFSVSANGSIASLVGSARVMIRLANGELVVHHVCRSLAEALAECNLFIDAHLTRLRTNRDAVLADSNRPREIYVERWIGNALAGNWELVQSGDFSGRVYGRRAPKGHLELVVPRTRFEFLDHAPRLNRIATRSQRRSGHTAIGNSHAPVRDRISLPINSAPGMEQASLTKDTVVSCVLTGRTKKGGWFAKLAAGTASGPITNADAVPATAQVGDCVTLSLNGINLDKRFASFRWVDQPSAPVTTTPSSSLAIREE